MSSLLVMLLNSVSLLNKNDCKMEKIDLLFVVVKWRKTSHQLIKNYTDEVPIYSFPMSTFSDHFRSQIGIGATKRICTVSVSFDALS